MHRLLRTTILCLLIVCSSTILCCRSVPAAFSITINYSGDPQFQPAFSNAKSVWESHFAGYQNGVVVSRSNNSSYSVGQTVNQLFITAVVEAIDGVGTILGIANVNEGIVDAANFQIATDGIMRFDSADVPALLADGSFNNVVLHEMAHVMGFGTLWISNSVYTAGSGEFTGASATAVWQSQWGQSGTPDVELEGPSGTPGTHWNEVLLGAAPTGIVDLQGRDMQNELMTGWLNANPFISDLTLASFTDIGFVRTTAIPEPSTMATLSLCGAFWALRRRQHRARIS